MGDLISVSVVDKLLRANVTLTPEVSCPLSKAAGRVLREDIFADRDLPPFDRCMLDGYALRASDAKPGAVFNITARVHAGEKTLPLSNDPLSAIEVMTGSMLPPGADVVIGYEEAEAIGTNQFRFNPAESLKVGDAIHKQASDYTKGTCLLKAGSVLGPVEVGIAASCGYAEPLCSQQPRIAIFGTGDELVSVSNSPEPHQIRESNLHAIENALALAGFNAAQVSRLSDDYNEQAKLAQAIEENDVIIISGAVSKGKRDWIPSALNSISQKILHGVSQRPGKPMGFWKKEDGPAIFGLPGNPISTLVATHRYVLPYLCMSLGVEVAHPFHVRLTEPYAFKFPKTLFLPITLDSTGRAVPQPSNNSGDYARLAGTTGFVELTNDQSDWTPETIYPYFPWQR